MRLPSVTRLVTKARQTLERFPAVLFAALAAAVAGIILASPEADEDFWGRILGTAALGIPLLFALDLYAERRQASLGDRVFLWAGAGAVLGAFGVAWFGWSSSVAFGRYVQLSTGIHLLVAFLPFVGIDQPRGFWNYNRGLLYRFLTSAIYTSVLYIGLAVALLAIENLFGIDVREETYFRLWMLIAFVFNTWFFLAGIPDDLDRLEEELQYPRELKTFAQYLLIPIVVVYLVILTTYLGKVVITTDWPSGWIGYLVSSVAALGIFSLLLVHPIAERTENNWIGSFARVFYFALFPSIVMLWLAIWQRVEQYGITERRYFMIVLSIWLASIAVYYAFTRSRNIRIIPVTLAVLAFITFGGPWSAYSISQASQVGRLETLLRQHEILQDGTLQPVLSMPPFADRREISAIVRYLTETHGTSRIDGWFGGRLAEIDTIAKGTEPSRAYGRPQLIVESMGLTYVDRYASGDEEYFSFYADRDSVVPIAGFEYLRLVDGLIHSDSQHVVDDVYVQFDTALVGVVVRRGTEAIAVVSLRPMLERARREGVEGRSSMNLAPELLRAEDETERAAAAVLVTNVTGRFPEGEVPDIQSLSFTLLLRLKQ